MVVIFFALTILSALLIQTNPLLFTVGSGFRLDASLLLVVYFSLFWDGPRALLLGFITGLCQDALSSEVLGLNALSKSVSAFIVHVLCRNIQVQNVVAQGFFTCLALAIDTFVHLVVMVMFQLNTLTLQLVFITTFTQQMLISLVCMPFVCRGLQALAKGLHVRPEKDRGNATAQ
jgi:rod shape-determining protein MreD